MKVLVVDVRNVLINSTAKVPMNLHLLIKVENLGVLKLVVGVAGGVADHAVEISKVVEVVVVVAVEISIIEMKMVHKMEPVIGNKVPSMFNEPWRTIWRSSFSPRQELTSTILVHNPIVTMIKKFHPPNDRSNQIILDVRIVVIIEVVDPIVVVMVVKMTIVPIVDNTIVNLVRLFRKFPIAECFLFLSSQESISCFT